MGYRLWTTGDKTITPSSSLDRIGNAEKRKYLGQDRFSRNYRPNPAAWRMPSKERERSMGRRISSLEHPAALVSSIPMMSGEVFKLLCLAGSGLDNRCGNEADAFSTRSDPENLPPTYGMRGWLSRTMKP
jgi:hypothetical protein